MATNCDAFNPVEGMEMSPSSIINISVDCDSYDNKSDLQFKMPPSNWTPIRRKSFPKTPDSIPENDECSRCDFVDLTSEDDSDHYSDETQSRLRKSWSNRRTIRKKQSHSGLSLTFKEELRHYLEERTRQLQSRLKVIHMPMARRCNKFGYSPDVLGRITDY